MKVEKLQKGRIVRKIIGEVVDQQLGSPSIIQRVIGRTEEVPQLLTQLSKQYGSTPLNLEQSLALEDFSRHLLTKDKLNLVFDPKSNFFSWQAVPFEDAFATWKHLPVMQENPHIKFGFMDKFSPIEVPYRGGTLKRVHFPKMGFLKPDESIVSPYIQFDWIRSPFDSFERSFLKPVGGVRSVDGKSIYMPGHLYNMGLIPSHQAKSLYNIAEEGLDLSRMSKQGIVDTMKTVEDLVAPNSSYLSGDFARSGALMDGEAPVLNIPMGAELMQRHSSGILLPDEVMSILNRDLTPDFYMLRGKNLSTDSFKLISDFGHKGSNGLRFGGWQDGFNALGTQNKPLLDLVEAFKRGDIPKDEYAKKMLDWMQSSYPSLSGYEPLHLVYPSPKAYKNQVFIRHPFGLKGFKKGGKIQKHQKGKIILNALQDLGDLVKSGDLKVKRPRIIVSKGPKVVSEKVTYTPRIKPTAEEKQIFNAFQKYKGTGVYATMPEDQAFALFKQEWAFRHDPLRIAVKDLHRSINHQDMISGTQTPDWMRDAMVSAVKINPTAFRTDLIGPTNIQFKYTSNPQVLSIPDYFPGQSYRGIGNYDTMFENATHAYLSGAPDAAKQFLSAGLSDAAAIARGNKPTIFKYKSTPGIVPMSVLEEIVARRGAPAGTVQWLHNINLQNPTLGTEYLDLFAKKPDYFKKMYNLDGTLIK